MKETHRKLACVCATLILGGWTPGQVPGSRRAHARFFSLQRVVNIGLVDYGHHAVDPAREDFIAENYDVLVSGDASLDLGFYQGSSSPIELFAYFNSFMLAPDQPAPSDEGAYLHDGSVPPARHGPANRIGKLFGGGFHYVMDPASPPWQDHARAQVEALLAAGFDGVLIDDVFAHLMHESHFNFGEPLQIGTPANHRPFWTVPGWYDAQASHDGWAAFLASLSGSLRGEVVYNGINDLAERQAPILPSLHPGTYLGVSDGAVQEGFVFNAKGLADPAAGLLGDEYWEGTVEVLMGIPAGKRHAVVSYGDVNNWRGRAYSLASFLLGYDPTQKQSFYYTPDEFTLTWLPEWSLRLGTPTDSFPSLADYLDSQHHVYLRHFSKGMVIVNPYGTATGLIPLGSPYFQVEKESPIRVQPGAGGSPEAIGGWDNLRFTRLISLQLAPYSAALLIR